MKKIIIFLAICLSFISCINRNKQLDLYVNQHIENNYDEISFTELNIFDWDSMIILAPYTSIESIEKKYRIDLSNCYKNIEMYDNINLIIFLEKNRFIFGYELNRNIIDFDDYDEIISKENAIFEKKKNKFVKKQTTANNGS